MVTTPGARCIISVWIGVTKPDFGKTRSFKSCPMTQFSPVIDTFQADEFWIPAARH